MKSAMLIIDNNACWGCKTCEVACKQENGSINAVSMIHVSENGPRMMGDRLEFTYEVNVCHHCEHPECVEVCMDEAIIKRDDGIVILDDRLCAGCRLCIEACPHGAILYDETENIAKKCNLCYHRVDHGLLPACADNVCLAHCIVFSQSSSFI